MKTIHTTTKSGKEGKLSISFNSFTGYKFLAKKYSVDAKGELANAINKILFEKGYILNYKFEENEKKQGTIKIALKYNSTNKLSAIRTLDRVSKPGLRKYSGVDTMPKVLNGLGIAIISTSKGVMTDRAARQAGLGGEIICYVA